MHPIHEIFSSVTRRRRNSNIYSLVSVYRRMTRKSFEHPRRNDGRSHNMGSHQRVAVAAARMSICSEHFSAYDFPCWSFGTCRADARVRSCFTARKKGSRFLFIRSAPDDNVSRCQGNVSRFLFPVRSR